MNKKTMVLIIVLCITCFGLGFYGATQKYTSYSNCIPNAKPYTVSWSKEVGESVTIRKGDVLFDFDGELIRGPKEETIELELSKGKYQLFSKKAGTCFYQEITIIVE